MKKFLSVLILLAAVLFSACGDSTSAESSEGESSSSEEVASSSSTKLSSSSNRYEYICPIMLINDCVCNADHEGIQATHDATQKKVICSNASGEWKWEDWVESSSSSVLTYKDVEYTEPSKVVKGSFKDARDGQEYKTVTIGPQTWMAENLRYAYLQKTASQDSSSFCINNSLDSCAKYGRYYFWSAAIDSAALMSDVAKDCGFDKINSNDGPCPLEAHGRWRKKHVVRGVCPEGWHLPDMDDVEVLLASVGGTKDMEMVCEWEGAAVKLKSTSGWEEYEGTDRNGTDDYGFNAIPAGFLSYSNPLELPSEVGGYASFWMAEYYNGYNAYSMSLKYFESSVAAVLIQKTNQLTVRCVKDYE